MWIQSLFFPLSQLREDDQRSESILVNWFYPEQDTAKTYSFYAITSANFAPLGGNVEDFTRVSYRNLITFCVHFSSSNNSNNQAPRGVYAPEAIWKIWRLNNGAKPTQTEFSWLLVGEQQRFCFTSHLHIKPNSFVHACVRACVCVCASTRVCPTPLPQGCCLTSAALTYTIFSLLIRHRHASLLSDAVK